MPPIDPKQLLKALGPLLTNDGGIKGAEEASRIIRLMTNAKKLVNRCIYLNILRVTTSQEALEKFLSMGGWDTLNSWLDSARNTTNDPLVGELLEVYRNLPVTIVILKQNTTAKTIKQLRKAEDEKIQKLSAELVDRWTKIIRDQKNVDNELEEKRKKKKHKEKEREREKEKDKSEKEKEKDNEKEKDRKDREKDSKNHHHHSHVDKDRKDKNRSRDKEKDRDRYKDKEKSRHSSSSSKTETKESSSIKNQSSSDSLSSSLKNNKNSANSSAKTPQNLDAPSSNYSATDPTSSESAQTNSEQGKEEESRRRPKTVKTYVGKFRSLGLSDDEGEADNELLKKKVVDKSAALKRVTIEKTEDMGVEKKPRLHLAMPPLNPTGIDGSSANTTPPEVTHGRIKIIPPKRAPAHEIHESNVFMDALQQSSSHSYAGFKRKKKLTSPSPSNPNAPPNLLTSTVATGSSPPPLAMSPPIITPSHEMQATSPPLLSPTTAMAQRLPSVPSFYRDTLEDLPEPSESDKRKADNREEDDDDDSSPPVLESMEVDEGPQDKKEEAETTEENEWGLGSAIPSNVEEDLLKDQALTTERPTKKKSVTWAIEARLEEVFYFELDEGERENVNRPRSFIQMKREEAMMDRRAMDAAKRFDNMVEVLPWKTPKLIDNVIIVVESGCNSKESEIQMEREKGVLCALFFNKVPDTPIEPDPDIPGEQEDTKLIPLEDENGSCTEYEHTYTQNDPSSLPYDPEFDLPLQSQGQGGMGPGVGNNFMNNGIGGNLKTMGMNLPPAISHLLQTLQQQAQETRDPLMANLQTMLSGVLQTTNPQDGNLLIERVLNTLEQFRNQIPGLNNLINSITNGNMDNVNMGGGGGGPRHYMNQGPSGPMGGTPRHSLLGPRPGFNMMTGGGGGMRPPHPPPMQGPGPRMGGGGGNPNFYMGKQGGPGPGSNLDKMRMGGPPPNQWRGGSGGEGSGRGGRRPFNKRERSRVCQHFINKGCKYGESCSFIHPAKEQYS